MSPAHWLTLTALVALTALDSRTLLADTADVPEVDGADADPAASAPGAGDDLPVTHTLRLPGSMAEPAAVAGEPRSHEHPHGTVLVAAAPFDTPATNVTEWDLATSTIVRRVSLPLPNTVTMIGLVRAGGLLHLMLTDYKTNTVWYLRLTPELRILSAELLGSGFQPSIATDGTVVTLRWITIPPRETPVLRLRMLDPKGHLLGAAAFGDLLRGVPYDWPLAVAGGKTFVLIAAEGQAPLLKLGADGRVEGRQTFANVDSVAGSIWVFDRRVFVGDRGSCSVEAFAADDLHRLPNHPTYPRARVGWCKSARLEADGSGHVAASTGQVLSSDLTPERRFAPPRNGDELASALWLSGAPAMLRLNGDGDVQLGWTDPL